MAAVTRKVCSSHLVSSALWWKVPFAKFLFALPSFFPSNLSPIPQTSINVPKLISCNFLLRHFHSALGTYSLDYIFIIGLNGLDQPLCSPGLPQPLPWPRAHGSPWQCPAPHSLPDLQPSCPSPSPLHCLSSGRCPMPGAGGAQLPSGVVRCHVLPSQVTMQGPSATGTQPPGSRQLNLNPLSPSEIARHYHIERSPPKHLFITCSLFTAVFPSMPSTNFILQFSHL